MTSTRIDGHVHFHPIFSLSAFLNGAERNFQAADGGNRDTVGVLLLAKIDAAPPLSQVQKDAPSVSSAWKFSQFESTSCAFTSKDTTIIIIAGRQIVTRENLELLVFCSDKPFPDRLPLRESIEVARANKGVPIVPWGFGKWWFSRGRVLQSILDSDFKGGLLLGDSGCRPSMFTPALISRATEAGIATLAGSDPLPIKSHEARAGSFGTRVPGSIDLNAPAEWVRESLTKLRATSTFGHGRSLAQFVNDQIRIRVARNR